MGSLSMTDHVSLANRFHLACASRLRFLFCARTGRGAPGDLLPKFGDVGGISLPYREKVPDARRGPACCCFEPTCMSTSAHASVLWVSLHGLRACHLGVGSALTSGCMPLVPELWFLWRFVSSLFGPSPFLAGCWALPHWSHPLQGHVCSSTRTSVPLWRFPVGVMLGLTAGSFLLCHCGGWRC